MFAKINKCQKAASRVIIPKVRRFLLNKPYITALRRNVHAFTESSIFSLPFLNTIRYNLYKMLYQVGTELGLGFQIHLQRPHFHHKADIIIGNRVWIGNRVSIDYSGGIRIGNNVSISDDVTIYTHDHSVVSKKHWLGRNGNKVEFYNLKIGDDAWIGAGAKILPKTTTIGANASIAAGSVVRNNVPPNAIVAGNPAKIVGYRE